MVWFYSLYSTSQCGIHRTIYQWHANVLTSSRAFEWNKFTVRLRNRTMKTKPYHKKKKKTYFLFDRIIYPFRAICIKERKKNLYIPVSRWVSAIGQSFNMIKWSWKLVDLYDNHFEKTISNQNIWVVDIFRFRCVYLCLCISRMKVNVKSWCSQNILQWQT